MTGTLHVVPLNDVIEHDTSGEPCVCGPDTELVHGPDGDTYIVTHHSLDGREGAEYWRGVSEQIIRDNLPEPPHGERPAHEPGGQQ